MSRERENHLRKENTIFLTEDKVKVKVYGKPNLNILAKKLIELYRKS